MSNRLVKTGWQRFLDRLKQPWGKSGQAVLPAAAASRIDANGASGPGASDKTPAPSPSGP